MFPFAHLGFALAILFLLRRNEWCRQLDVRYFLLGVWLPDLVGKPLGLVGLTTGRAYSHTLIFVLLISFGLWLFQGGKKGEKNRRPDLALLIATLSHLVLDQMFLTPQTFFWPLFGLGFPALEISVSSYVQELLTNTFTQLTELAGLLIAMVFGVNYGLYKRSKLHLLLTRGTIMSER